MTRDYFIGYLNMLAECYRVPVSEGMLEGYWLVLEPVPEVYVAGAVKHCLETCRFMPSAAELLSSAKELRRDARLKAAGDNISATIRGYLAEEPDNETKGGQS